MAYKRLDLRNWFDIKRELGKIPTERTSENVMRRFMVYYDFLSNEKRWLLPESFKDHYREMAEKRRDALCDEYNELLAKERAANKEEPEQSLI